MGHGSYTDAKGSTFTGTFYNDMKHGKHLIQKACGEVWIAEFYVGVYHGRTTIYSNIKDENGQDKEVITNGLFKQWSTINKWVEGELEVE